MEFGSYIKNSNIIKNDSSEYLNFLKDNGVIISSEDWGEVDAIEDIDVLNDQNWDKISKDFDKNGYVVIDDVFKEEYLDRLYFSGLYNNIREDLRPGFSTVNFYKEQRRWFPLLTNSTDELIEKFKKKIKFSRGWQLLFDSMCEGVGLHVDPQADITMNFWVTPDENCIYDIDEYANGLLLLGLERPTHFEYFPSDDVLDEYIQKQNPEVHLIKHKCNRGIIFKSDMYHKTFCVHTEPGYHNRRVTYAFLFLDLDKSPSS